VARPIVAIVGRPNVGKSTLFNRILGWRKAIVDPQSGLTRDRLYGVAEWSGREFTVVDTAGLDLDTAKDSSQAAIEAQTKVAIDQADVIVLLLDVREGLTPIDREIAQMLRRSRQRVIVAANKADSPTERHFAHEILELGFAEPSLLSAQHGIGVGDFLDRVLEELPPPEVEPPAEEKADRLAIMGRPNVGKSSLLNALLGDERALVSPVPGTTRDPIDTELIYDGIPVVLIDTAGIRRKSSSRDQIERYSLMRGIHAMERADAVLLVLDASAGVLAQDQHVAGYALEAGKGLVIVVNKIDLVPPIERKPAHWRALLARDFKFAPFAPIVAVSARTKEGIGGILPAALEVVGQRRIKMPPNELNRVLREAFLSHPPPSYKGRRLKLGYATQAGGEAPTVVMFVNDTGLLHFSYRRYLEHQIRNRFGLIGNPLRLVLRASDAKGIPPPERRKRRSISPASGEVSAPARRKVRDAAPARGKARGAAPHPSPPPARDGTRPRRPRR
ncbi:MAG TPA: ribosome biogenesis GTPase Der, partial [Candidatus Dormibacteraeota bacterium]|nr:ribosome biogenesis GTPase Der [Candidatus Dormibacteraeota bacterium]